MPFYKNIIYYVYGINVAWAFNLFNDSLIHVSIYMTIISLYQYIKHMETAEYQAQYMP